MHESRDASAEGVLVALRRCSIDDAFIDIVLAAKRHNVAPLGLAGALVTIAQNDSRSRQRATAPAFLLPVRTARPGRPRPEAALGRC